MLSLSRSVYHYQSSAADQGRLVGRSKELATTRVRYGYKRIYVRLKREGWLDDCERRSGNQGGTHQGIEVTTAMRSALMPNVPILFAHALIGASAARATD